MKKTLLLSLVASSLLMADADLDLLKDQVAQQQAMINKLLQKIEKIEDKESSYKPTVNVKADKNAPRTYSAPTAQTPKSKTFDQSSFMPNISLIADMSYVSRSVDDGELAHLEIPGVAHGIMGTHEHGGNSHAPYNADKGFNLNYAELGLSKAVDQNFKVDAIFHFSESSVEIEELYFTTSVLGNGLKLKGGKFNSDFGYHNNQHHHYWSFADNALVYEAFLGMHGINETGLQVQWTAPTDTYLMVGAEVLQGDNEQMFGNAAIHLSEDLNTTYSDLSKKDAPGMFVGYVKSSVDIGDTTVLGGLSYAKGNARLDHTDDEDGPHAFAGKSELYGADLLVKHYFDSFSSLAWQTEVLSRKMEGTLYPQSAAGETQMTKKQKGLFSQLVYAPNKTWKMGVRYDSIFKNDIVKSVGTEAFSPDDMEKYSAMIEYNTSEFARLRLQYNENRALYNEDGQKQNVNSLILQANFAIGAHGAHSF